jgi:hypothetical protein
MAQQGIAKGTATAGTTHKVATYEVTESAEARQIQRFALNDSNGGDLTSTSTQNAPTNVSLPTANTAVKVINSGAKIGWMIHNINDDVEVYLGFHSSVSTSNGIRIFSGGSYEMRGFGIFLGDIYVVCGTSSKNVRVQTW